MQFSSKVGRSGQTPLEEAKALALKMKQQKADSKNAPVTTEKPTANKYPRTVLHTKDLSEVTKAIEELTA